MPNVKRVLVIDDEPSIRESLEMFLTEKGLLVSTAATGSEGLELWQKHNPQVIILDIKLPDISGLDILKKITAKDPDVKVIMITAHHDMESTIKAMRRGAYDYIHKPLDVDELDHAVAMGQHIAAASEINPPFLRVDRDPDPRHCIVGKTPSMRTIFKTIGLLSRNRATVLIEGETGTGKDLIARVIHESSDLKDQPYVTVDCTTLVDNLLESELFGHERGAFTGAVDTKRGRLELAGKGTIFFDEVGDLPLSLQAKLLRFLEYREFTRVGGTQTYRSQARIIAATNHNLKALTRQGRFREDLLFRLKVISLHVPPLRDRIEDLPEMVQVFLANINRELHTNVTRVEKGAMTLLRSHYWPGNVRELINVMTKAVLESRGSVLLADAVERTLPEIGREILCSGGMQTLDEIEKEHILKSLDRTGGNLSAAAKALGLSRPTLRKRLKRYGYYET
jgi:two-component system response regulator AtoC